MQKKNQNNQKGIFFLIRIAALALAFCCVVTCLQLRSEISEKRQRSTELDSQISEQEVINDALRDQIDNGVSDEYIASVAREKLGYIMPGERVFVDSSSK